jgi:hypothetical protein
MFLVSTRRIIHSASFEVLYSSYFVYYCVRDYKVESEADDFCAIGRSNTKNEESSYQARAAKGKSET